MDVTLVTNNGEEDYTFDPMPSVVISTEVTHEESTSTPIERKVTWDIEGTLIPGGTSIVAQVAALESHFAVGELDTAVINGDATELESMPTDRGIRVTSIKFPQGSGPEWATKRRYSVTLEGIDYETDATDDGVVEYTISYATEQNTLITRTITGKLTDDAGADAYNKWVDYKSDQDWATWTVTGDDANLIRDEYTQNKQDTEISFSIVHKLWFQEFPVNITNANVTTTSRVDNQNVTKTSVFGWFEGSDADCTTAVNAIIPSGASVITDERGRNEYTNRTSFTISYIGDTEDILFYRETVSIEPMIDDFVHKRVLNGEPPVKQYTSFTPARAVQSGIVRRLTLQPVAPKYRWPAESLRNERLSKVSAEVVASTGEHTYTLHYTYEFEFNYNPPWPI